jgi:hypothetical protein
VAAHVQAARRVFHRSSSYQACPGRTFPSTFSACPSCFALLAALVWVGAASAFDRSSLALTPLPKPALGPQAGGLSTRLGDRHERGRRPRRDRERQAGRGSPARPHHRLHARLQRRGRGALRSGHGLLEVKTAVELYANAGAAARGLAFWRKDDAAAAAFQDPGRVVHPEPVRARASRRRRFAYDGIVTVGQAADLRRRRPVR